MSLLSLLNFMEWSGASLILTVSGISQVTSKNIFSEVVRSYFPPFKFFWQHCLCHPNGLDLDLPEVVSQMSGRVLMITLHLIQYRQTMATNNFYFYGIGKTISK